MNNPKISVITVCYNAVTTIEKSILSVIGQTYQNIEYIIIDGGSKDGTIDVINNFCDSISFFVSEPDNGIYDAMNKAAKVATGDYLFFLNSDDVFYNNTILSEIAAIMISDNTIYYGDVKQIPGGKIYGGVFKKWRLSYTNICHQSIFYPRMVFEVYSYDTRYKIYADWNLNIMCFADPNIQFRYIHKLITYYSLGGLSNISPKDDNFNKDFYRLVATNFGWPYCLARFFINIKIKFIMLVKNVIFE